MKPEQISGTQIPEIDRAAYFRDAKRIVIKVGSNVLTRNNCLNLEAVYALSRQVCQLTDRGMEVLFVSSGALAAGMTKVGLDRRPEEIPHRQAAAAVGQAGLILEYERAFAQYGRKVAQILLTGDGLTHRKRYLNARNTLNTLIAWKVIPIINENDTVSIEEIKFGDNDNLSAIITLLMNADLLINLTDIDGLYDKDPRLYPDASLIPIIKTFDDEIEKFASDIPGALGTGGMLSKIRAAKKVTIAGIPMVIAKGEKTDILLKLFDGEKHGTFFVPSEQKLSNRKRWIGYTAKPEGVIRVDNGAAEAILKRGKSLLPSGITDVENNFQEGAPVAIKNQSGDTLGIGLVNYRAADVRLIMGLKTGQIKDCLGSKPYDEVIHRDNLVVTNGV